MSAITFDTHPMNLYTYYGQQNFYNYGSINLEYTKQCFDHGSQLSTDSDQHNDSFQTTTTKKKTSLCKNFSKNLYCPYGDKCQFAHGVQELKCNATAKVHYKTKICLSYAKKMYCPYGDRCNYIHQKSKKNKNWKIKMQNFGQLIRQEIFQRNINKGFTSKLIPIFQCNGIQENQVDQFENKEQISEDNSILQQINEIYEQINQHESSETFSQD